MNKTKFDPGRFLYVGAAIVLAVLAFIGFHLFYLHGQAYPGRPLTPPIRNVIIAHGVAMSLWMILFIVQPLLITNAKYRIHMFLGKVGAVLAICVFFLGLQVAVVAAKVNPSDLKLWELIPKEFLAIPICAIILFGGFVAVGIWKRRQAEIHRSMMLLAAMSAVAAAIDRISSIKHLYEHNIWGRVFGPFFPLIVIGVVFLLIKRVLTKSFDRPYAVGCVVIAIAGALSMKLATTPVWDSFASFLLKF